jgi:hypothetical protein
MLSLPFLTNNFHDILQYCAHTCRNWEVLCVFYKCFLYQIHTNVVLDFSCSLLPLDPHVNGVYVVPVQSVLSFISQSNSRQCQLNKLYFTSLSFNIHSWVLLTITQTILSISAGTGDWKKPGSVRLPTTFPATYGHCQLHSVSCHQCLILKTFLEYNHPSNILS